MGDWNKKSLSDIIAILESGTRPRGGVTTVSGEVPSLGGENIVQSGGVSLNVIKKVPQSFYEKMTKGHLKDGDVLINKDGANTGKLGIFKGFNLKKACINEHLFLIRANEEVHNTFLYYFLLLEKTQQIIKNKISGSAQPGLNSGFIKNFPFKYPENISEQSTIATILTTIDQAIEKTKQLIAKYERIKTGLMQDLLTRGIDEHGNIRREETHEFKEERGFRIPNDWNVIRLGNYLENIEQGWSPNCDSEPASPFEWGVLKTSSVTWDGFFEFENKRLPYNVVPQKQYEIRKGDVLITRAGPNSRVGVVSFVENVRDKLILSDKLYRLIPKTDIVPKYLSIALSSQFTQNHLEGFKTGMAESQTNISQKIVQDLSVLLPPKKEQYQIVENIEGLESILNSYKVELEKNKSLKTALMQDLLTGKVRVDALMKKTKI
jgi:type I restriction enzyme S subunit